MLNLSLYLCSSCELLRATADVTTKNATLHLLAQTDVCLILLAAYVYLTGNALDAYR